MKSLRNLSSSALAALLPAAEFYVARGGDDANPGTPTRPFASVGRAQQAELSRLLDAARFEPFTPYEAELFSRNGLHGSKTWLPPLPMPTSPSPSRR